MGKRNKITTRDIAEKLGISQSTVSMILSDKPGVSFKQETVKAVKNTAAAMGYKRPQRSQKTGVESFRDTILVVCPDISNLYYSTIIESIIDQAKKYNYTVLSVCTHRDKEIEKTYTDLVKNTLLAGLILLYAPSSFKEFNTLAEKVPVIFIGDKPSFCRFNAVKLNNVKPATILGEYLISLGHERIAYISPPINKRELGRKRRLEGIKKSFNEREDSNEKLFVFEAKKKVFGTYPYEKANYLNGYNLTSEILDKDLGITAFIGYNDMTAFGIMASIIDHGYKIPNDFSVCGFDNTALSSLPQFSLTTMDHAVTQKGKEAVKMIHQNNLNKAYEQSGYVIGLEYEPQLIVRGSTGPKKR